MTVFILGITAFTSFVAFLIGGRLLGWPAGGLRPAVARTLECVGATCVFALANFAAGAALVLGTRVAGGPFLSSYFLGDPIWLVLSLLQGLTWCLWRAG